MTWVGCKGLSQMRKLAGIIVVEKKNVHLASISFYRFIVREFADGLRYEMQCQSRIVLSFWGCSLPQRRSTISCWGFASWKPSCR